MTPTNDNPPPILDYASPTSDAPVPGSQIVIAFLGGISLLVLALLFCGGAVVSILRDFHSILTWILSILFVVVGVAFGLGGLQEIHRGITQHFRR